MRAIFISYRRNDSEGESGRLFDDLVREFGEECVFMDLTNIEAGRDFRKVIDESVATCGILLAVIGKNWIEAKDDSGRRRLDDPLDFVRLETGSALKRDIPVIPVIVRGAAMPRPEHLPPDLKDLAYRNFVELTHARWTSDLQLLIGTLRRQLGDHKSGAVRAVGEADTADDATVAQIVAKEEPARGEAPKRLKDPDKKNWLLPLLIATAVIAIAVAGYFLWPRQVTVPNVRGNTLADATEKLQAAHLKVGLTTTREDPSKDANLILSQFPPSDEQVRRGTAVDLVVSAPVAQVEVPALTGQSLEAAQQALADRQLNVGELERQSRAGTASGVVLQEFPKPGEMVKRGAKVDLLVSDVPPQTSASSSTSNAANTANEKWAAQRAEAKHEAALKAAATKAAAAKAAAENAAANKATMDKAAADKAAADKTATDKAIADKAAAEKAAADQAATAARPRITIRTASCTTVKPGQYKVELAGDAYAPANDAYLFYVWVAVDNNGTRWRPVCSSWSVPQAGEDPLADVTCIHRGGDPTQTAWQTSRIINSKSKLPPNNGGTAIFKMGAHSASTLKFNLTCQ